MVFKASGNGLEELFASPPANATRVSAALQLEPAAEPHAWLTRQLGRAQESGVGGVLFDLTLLHGPDLWPAAEQAIGLADKLGLESGLVFSQGTTNPPHPVHAQTLVWTNTLFEAGTNGPAHPVASLPTGAVQLALLAVPETPPDRTMPHALELGNDQLPTGGIWRIWRFGTLPATPTCLDPFNERHLFKSINNWLFEAQKRLGGSYGNSLLWLHFTGTPQRSLIWSDTLPGAFLRRSGLALTRNLPALAGAPVGGEANAAHVRRQMVATQRQLWRDNYGATVNDLVQEAGLDAGINIDQTPVEAVEVALYMRRPTLPNARGLEARNANLQASGGARVLGRRYVMGALVPLAPEPCESDALMPFPWKHEADNLFMDGATRLLLHFEHGLPSDDKQFRQLRTGCRYAHRCQAILQQGEATADMLVWAEKPLDRLSSFSCDYANAAILAKAAVQNGTIRFASERSYALLAVESARLAEPEAERILRRLAERGVRVWVFMDGTSPAEGVSRLLASSDLITAISKDDCLPPGRLPDFEWRSDAPGMRLRFLHRRIASRELYFIVNDSDETGSATCTFRDAGKGLPTRWDPATGETGSIAPLTDSPPGRLSLQLFMAPRDSCFVVFDQ